MDVGAVNSGWKVNYQGVRLLQVTPMQVTAHRDPRMRAHASQSSADPSTGPGTGTSNHQQPQDTAGKG